MHNMSTRSELANIKVMVARFVVPVVVILSLDGSITQILPSWISYLRTPLLLILIYSPSWASYKMSKIPEFLVPLFSIIIIFLFSTIQFVFSLIEFSIGNSQLVGTMLNILLLSLWLPWIWFALKLLDSKFQRILYLVLASGVVMIGVIFQFIPSLGYSYLTVNIALISLSLSVIMTLSSVDLLYNSSRTKRGKYLLLIAFSILGFANLIELILPSFSDFSLINLGLDSWLLCVWLTVFFNSDAFIPTKSQTLSTVHAYYQIKRVEVGDCVVFDNIDTYIRYMPEELVLTVDDNDLTMVWIGLQRND